MANTLFRLDNSNTIIIHPEAIKLAPELFSLTQDEMRYVTLAYDYLKSPYRLKPPEERQSSARKLVFKNDTWTENKKVKDAALIYKELIYDPRRETIDSINSRVSKINMDIDNDQLSIKEIKERLDLQELLVKRKEDLEKQIDTEEEAMSFKGDIKLSFLEKWQIKSKKR